MTKDEAITILNKTFSFLDDFIELYDDQIAVQSYLREVGRGKHYEALKILTVNLHEFDHLKGIPFQRMDGDYTNRVYFIN